MNKRVWIAVAGEGWTYREDITEDVAEDEESYYRPMVALGYDAIKQANGNHYIYGWYESFMQGDIYPAIVLYRKNKEIVSISVWHEQGVNEYLSEQRRNLVAEAVC